MRVYLAGKMDEAYGSWRDVLLADQHYDVATGRYPKWRLLADLDSTQWDSDRISRPWPTVPNRLVLGLHEYVGPYRTDVHNYYSKNMGEFHGSIVQGSHGQSNGDEDGLIVQECLRALQRADLVFAYINRPDCFGTLVEIGLAKESGAYVAVAVEEGAEWDWSDYWFVEHVADAMIRAGEPVTVGEEPSYPPPSGLLPHERAVVIDARVAWYERKKQEEDRIRGVFKDAVIAWTARPARVTPSSLALVRPEETEDLKRELLEIVQSFSQIVRWSSDPRVRNEAQRMLKRMTG